MLFGDVIVMVDLKKKLERNLDFRRIKIIF